MEIKGLEERALRVRSPLLMSYGKEGVGWSGQCQCWKVVDIAKNHYLILSYREAQGLQKCAPKPQATNPLNSIDALP